MGKDGNLISKPIKGSTDTKPTNPLHLTGEALQEFLKNVDPTHHSEATRLLKQYTDPVTGETKSSSVALVQNLNSVKDILIFNGKYRLPAADQKIFDTIAQSNYENLLETKFDLSKEKATGPIPMFEVKFTASNQRYVVVKDNYIARAKKEGWDSASWIAEEKIRLEGLHPQLRNDEDSVESKPNGMSLDELKDLGITSKQLKDVKGVNFIISEAIANSPDNQRYIPLNIQNNLQMLDSKFGKTSNAKVFWDSQDRLFIIDVEDFKNVTYNISANND